MLEIQRICVELSCHVEADVSQSALKIAQADLARDVEYDNQLVELKASNSTLAAKNDVLKQDNRLLRSQLNKINDLKFGQSSEKTSLTKKKKSDDDPDGLSATPSPINDPQKSESSGAFPEQAEKPKPRGKLGRQAIKIPDYLPSDKRFIEPPNGAICECGCGLRRMGEQVIKRLSYKPAQIKVIEETYPKYVCRTCDRFVQAPVPKRAFDYTRFDDKLIAGLVVSKFADFIPNYRQEQIFKRSGIRFHRSTMSRLVNEAAMALLSVHDALEKDLKSSSKLSMDETVLAQLLPGNGRTKTCYVWALCRDDRRWKGNSNPGVLFHFKQSRKGQHAEDILDGYQGILQVDGYAGYNRLTHDSRNGGPLTLAYCWAHVRRKFLDVHKATKSPKAFEIFALINQLYEIERGIKAQLSNVRLAIRQRDSVPMVAKFFAMLKELSGHISMKSTLGQAITYALKLEAGLKVFLLDGRVEIDNNAIENTIRPTALLRKNALFAGSPVGGRNWAVMSSLIGTCRLNGVEPYAYLTWVFEQMANGHPRSQYDKLLPWQCPNGKFGME